MPRKTLIFKKWLLVLKLDRKEPAFGHNLKIFRFSKKNLWIKPNDSFQTNDDNNDKEYLPKLNGV